MNGQFGAGDYGDGGEGGGVLLILWRPLLPVLEMLIEEGAADAAGRQGDYQGDQHLDSHCEWVTVLVGVRRVAERGIIIEISIREGDKCDNDCLSVCLFL